MAYPCNLFLSPRAVSDLYFGRGKDKGLAFFNANPLIELVGAVGFELTTLCSQSRCATRLRYAPNFLQLRFRKLCFSSEELDSSTANFRFPIFF